MRARRHRQSHDGLRLFGIRAAKAIAVPNDKKQRDLVLDEFAAATPARQAGFTTPLGRSPIGVCWRDRVVQTRREIELKQQVSIGVGVQAGDNKHAAVIQTHAFVGQHDVR